MEHLKLEMGAFYFDGSGVLFSEVFCNGLFYWDIARNQTFILGTFEKNPLWSEWMSYEAVRRKNDLFFLPYLAYGIPYFNMGTKEIGYCGMPSCLDGKVLNYYGYAEQDNLIYMFPVCPLEDVLILDMEQKRITEIVPDWNTNMINTAKMDRECSLNGYSCKGKKVWISYRMTHGVYELTLNSWEVRFHEWEQIACPVILLTNDKEVWIEDQSEAAIYHINEFGEITERYALEMSNCQGNKLFCAVITLKNGIRMVLPDRANIILLIDADRQLHCLRIDNDINMINGQYLCYRYLEFDEEVWLMPHSDNDIIIVNLKNYSLGFKRLPIPDGWRKIRRFISKMQYCESHRIVGENMENITLQDFYNYIRIKKENIIQGGNTKNFGVKIWQEINK